MSDSQERTSGDSEGISTEENAKETKETTNVITSTIVLLALVNFCYAICLSLQGPLFPKLAEKKGLQPKIYSLVFGAYYLTFLISIPLIGIAVQRVKCKFVLFTGAFAVGSCAILFGALEWCPKGSEFTALAISIRIVEGFGAASIKMSSYAIATSRFPLQMWRYSMYVESFFAVGLMIGPVIGGAAYDAQGFGLPFYCSGVLTLLAAALVISILPEPDGVKINLSWKFFSLFKYATALMYIYENFSVAFYYGFVQAMLEPFLKQFSGFFLGLFFAAPVISRYMTIPGWQWLNEKGFNGVMLIAISSLIIVSSTLLLGPAPFLHIETSSKYIISALVLMGLGEAGQYACGFEEFFRDIVGKGYSYDVSTHGLIFEMFAFSMTFGAFIGSSVSGIVNDSITFQNGTLIFFALELLSLPFLVVYSLRRNYRRRSRRFEAPDETTNILPKTESA